MAGKQHRTNLITSALVEVKINAAYKWTYVEDILRRLQATASETTITTTSSDVRVAMMTYRITS